MPNHKSCKKKVKVNRRRHAENLKVIKSCKKNIKLLKAEKDKVKAQDLLRTVYKELDKLSCKHRIHKKKSARLKSKLAISVNNLS